MRFIFDSLDELKQFISFVNSDKDELIKKETEELNRSSDKLKQAVENSGVNLKEK